MTGSEMKRLGYRFAPAILSGLLLSLPAAGGEPVPPEEAALDAARALYEGGGKAGEGKTKEEALVDAIANGHLTVVRYLLGHKVDPRQVRSQGRTALHLALEPRACGREREAIVKRLVQAGASVNATDNYGDRPLDYACHYSGVPGYDGCGIARFLLANGADPKGGPGSTGTPLFYCLGAEAKALELAELLLSSGADPNATISVESATLVNGDLQPIGSAVKP